MEERCYLPKINFEGLIGESFAELLRVKNEASEKLICLDLLLDDKFDQWDIEGYIRSIQRLEPKFIRITVAEEFVNKPTLNQIREVQGALEHFAKFVNYDAEKRVQNFAVDDIQIQYVYEKC